ncbi:MAG: hypothetical protein KDC73_10735 [Ignavibacteriae bacterium]|nr:hypothetical protein [Ignavibacteriota bacterium]MCB9242510.1 hypothetical protein [Ignavibacteriales bacterium]
MIVENQILYLLEEFKIPFKDPYCPNDWKDWYHYILYDPKTKVRFLYNICFNGKPETGYITDTFFLTVPKGFIHGNISNPNIMETYGFARNTKWDKLDLNLFPFQYICKNINFAIHHNVSKLDVSNKQSEIEFKLVGKTNSDPIYIPELAPFGKGFMGWGVIPDYKMAGIIGIGNKRISVTDQWYGYHDRNFGRFNWGNIGWTWFVINTTDAKGASWTFVLHRSNNNDFSRIGSPILFIYNNKTLNKVFLGATIDIQIKWSTSTELHPILPGAMASVFSDRTIKTPYQLIVRAKDEVDNILIVMDTETQTELIVPDNQTKNFTFLKELSGHALIKQNLRKKAELFENAFFYAEYVH